MQFAVTLTPASATTNAENKNKNTSGGESRRVGRHISYPKVRMVGGFKMDVACHSNAPFEELICAACDENSGQWLGILYCDVLGL